MVPEAMRAAWILKREYGYETRILNMHTLNPIDVTAVIHAARENGVIVLGPYGIPVITGAIGVKDRFGESGAMGISEGI
jgi:transketolase